MGVTGLWTVVQPCARPIKLETLNKKRLAVDASIWIYQFLKAVRDKEGNALRNSHVVGFFRRICKLLFFGIKPVFVFDGGAPALKRQTIAGRKRRREGRREDAVRTAGKLLAMQMQRRAEEEAEKRKQERERPPVEEEEIPDNLLYVDELQMTQQERQQNRKFKKKDAYHLPELDESFEKMGAPHDPRIMSHEELEEYARQFNTGEDINLYDFSKIDFNSPFFLSLPASDRYNILNAARLRSRLRMGYSKEQLDNMFPDRMAFSRFQIERVTERNELTQRLMNINGMNGEDAMFGVNGVGRVAGEKGKEYVLVKNDGVEGGWALGVVTSKDEGERSKPIDIDNMVQPRTMDDEDESNDDSEAETGFEDVPIEGLNRLPKRRDGIASIMRDSDGSRDRELAQRRRALYASRKQGTAQVSSNPDSRATADPDSLFFGEDGDEGEGSDRVADDLFEDITGQNEDDGNEALDRAIAMSLEDHVQGADGDQGTEASAVEALKQSKAAESRPFAKGSGRILAHVANNRSIAAAPKPIHHDSNDDDEVDLQTTHAGSSKPVRTETSVDLRDSSNGGLPPKQSNQNLQATPKSSAFSGPLPFEKLDFSKSLLGAKKAKESTDQAGGFEKEPEPEPEAKEAKPLPPWFSSGVLDTAKAEKEFEDRQRTTDGAKENGKRDRAILHRQSTGDVIDVESSHDGDSSDVDMVDFVPVDSEIRMGDLADLGRAEPPEALGRGDNHTGVPPEQRRPESAAGVEEEPIEWEESDREESRATNARAADPAVPVGGALQRDQTKSPLMTFEVVGSMGDVDEDPPSSAISLKETEQDGPIARPSTSQSPVVHDLPPSLPTVDSFDHAPAIDEDVDDYSDPEDEDLMRQLAVEAEEHARFASELNHKSQGQNHEDYERDLRALRNQQKKDRRDADEVTQIMITECQQLLKLFGLPYITAPMEAEAQCAELVRLGLVDGIVTDDSDCFLFGGTRIYKNMFNSAKFVECYLASDLEKEFDLDRDKLIRIAHLLGSDYTEGIPTVGPVTALEIVSEFNSEHGLEDFKEWWHAVQLGQHSPDDSKSSFRRKFVSSTLVPFHSLCF